MRGLGHFMPLWGAESLSNLGTQLTGFALGVWAYRETGSVAWLSLFALAATAPKVLIAPAAGVLADRFDRRRVLRFGHAASGVCTLLTAALFATGTPDPAFVLPLVGLSALVSAAQYPAFQAATTLLVPKSELARASGLVHFGFSAAAIVAPATAGVLLGEVGVAGVLLLDVLTFVSAWWILRDVKIPRASGGTPEGSEAGQLALGFLYLRHRPPMMALLGLFATLAFCLGLTQLLVTPLILAIADEVALGQVLSASGLGLLAGSAAMLVWGGPRSLIGGIAWLCGAQGLLLTATAVARTPLGVAVGLFFVFSLRPLLSACSAALWQKKVHPALQGRVFAVRSMVVQGAVPLAYLAAGPLTALATAWTAPDAALTSCTEALFGVEPGRHIALLIAALGAALVALAAATRLYPRLWRLDDELPDAEP
ncbi:MAG: MFS transporter [Acidobacteriota bacterium]